MAKRAYGRKLKQAVHLLFFKHHRLPGVRGWELRRALGPEWLDVLEVLDSRLKPLDLEVRRVFEETGEGRPEEARYYITLRGGVEQRTAKTLGWRIDDIAGLAVAVAYIAARGGKAPVAWATTEGQAVQPATTTAAQAAMAPARSPMPRRTPWAAGTARRVKRGTVYRG